MASTISAAPATFEMASGETLPLSFDVTRLLKEGDGVSSPSATLINLTTGEEHPDGLLGPPSVAGTAITQTITSLAAKSRYRLLIGFTAAAGKVWQVELQISCPF